MDFASSDRLETHEEESAPAAHRAAPLGDATERKRRQDEMDVYLAFGAFPGRNMITTLGLAALTGAAIAGVVAAFLAA